ncbi:PTS sugar transporter subunit IIA [Solobacterium moorei]|uniref:PTS system fructose IIA component n=1 Tax=Solobacterium moorei F0204 TaxID=706433 RepID=E7MLT5_9FIRM|nr:PTS system fructose IIA component [Solobacterium moorei]EFW24941.1 PTS system fructose IIA component [Solobacterium moorei F0204]
MIGIIIVTHSNFAEGIKNSVEMIAGKQDNFTAINFENGKDIEDLKNRISQKAEEYTSKGLDVIYVTDLKGATPFNACLYVSTQIWGPVVAGLCLPILLELVLTRDTMDIEDLSSYVRYVITNAKESIQVIDVNELM